MTRLWTSTHPAQTQQLANALVQALRYIAGHSAQQIAEQMPAEFFGGDRALYVEALQASLAMFTPDGTMPPSGPATVLKVLKAVDRAVGGKTIDLSKTYTTEFVRAVPP